MSPFAKHKVAEFCCTGLRSAAWYLARQFKGPRRGEKPTGEGALKRGNEGAFVDRLAVRHTSC